MGVHYELSEEEKFYRNALTRMPDGPAALEEAYNAVEDIVGEVEQYVKVWVINRVPFTTGIVSYRSWFIEIPKIFSFCFAVSVQVWLQYQCLWDMQAENIYNRLGEDLTKWQALLVQIRKARGTFDNAETRKEFGPVVIDYGKVIILTESLPFILKTIKIIYVFRKQIVLSILVCLFWASMWVKVLFHWLSLSIITGSVQGQPEIWLMAQRGAQQVWTDAWPEHAGFPRPDL